MRKLDDFKSKTNCVNFAKFSLQSKLSNKQQPPSQTTNYRAQATMPAGWTYEDTSTGET